MWDVPTSSVMAAAAVVLLLAAVLLWKRATRNADLVQRVLALKEAPGTRYPILVRLAALVAGVAAREPGADGVRPAQPRVPTGQVTPGFPIPVWAFWCALRPSRISLPSGREGMCRRAAAMILAARETLRALEAAEEDGTTRNRRYAFSTVQFEGRGWRLHRRPGSATVLVSCAGNRWAVDCTRVSEVAPLARCLEVACSHTPGDGRLALATAGTAEDYLRFRSSILPAAGETLEAVDNAICAVSMEPESSPEGLDELGRCLRAWPSPSRLYTAGMQICVFGNAEAGVIHHHYGLAGMPAAMVDGMMFRHSEALLAAAPEFHDAASTDNAVPVLVPLRFGGPMEPPGRDPIVTSCLPARSGQIHTWRCDVFVRATAAAHGLSLHPILAIATQVVFRRLCGRFLFVDVAARDDGDFIDAPVCNGELREFLDAVVSLDVSGDWPACQQPHRSAGLDYAALAPSLRRACRAVEAELRAIRSGQGAYQLIRRRLDPLSRAVCLGLLTLEPTTHEKVDISDIGRRIGVVAFGPAMFGWPRRARAAVRFCDGDGFVAVDLFLSPASDVRASDFRPRFQEALTLLRRILEAEEAGRTAARMSSPVG